MPRRKLTLLVAFAVATMISACSAITSPNRDGEEDGGEERCQVTQGSETRCTPTDTTSRG